MLICHATTLLFAFWLGSLSRKLSVYFLNINKKSSVSIKRRERTNERVDAISQHITIFFRIHQLAAGCNRKTMMSKLYKHWHTGQKMSWESVGKLFINNWKRFSSRVLFSACSIKSTSHENLERAHLFPRLFSVVFFCLWKNVCQFLILMGRKAMKRTQRKNWTSKN